MCVRKGGKDGTVIIEVLPIHILDIIHHCYIFKRYYTSILYFQEILYINVIFSRALDAGWLSEAFLDVFPVEPLPVTSKLWSHPRVTGCTHYIHWGVQRISK